LIVPIVAFFILVFIIVAFSYLSENDNLHHVLLDDGEILNIEGYQRISETPSPERLHTFLLKQFHYYTLLNEQEQLMFRNRLYVLLKSKWFIAKEGLQLHDAMILFICASMVQITMGLKHFEFPRFNKIALFPDTFYSSIIEREVKGLTVYHSGLVIMSWPHAYSGHAIPNDKINLILHELAHALYLDYFGNRRMLYGFDEWQQTAYCEFETMERNENHPFLRAYASTNIHEFWAVCIEHFFEAPQEFRKQLPELYRAMSKILNQDIASRIDQLKVASKV
jgi:Mlc titration factor MtfA (ptsG expression regulator)